MCGVPDEQTTYDLSAIFDEHIAADKAAHERSYSDQASLLVQVGLLDETLLVADQEGPTAVD